MKTKKEIIDYLTGDQIWFMNKFYINGLLYALDREDLLQTSYTEKRRKYLIQELRK